MCDATLGDMTVHYVQTSKVYKGPEHRPWLNLLARNRVELVQRELKRAVSSGTTVNQMVLMRTQESGDNMAEWRFLLRGKSAALAFMHFHQTFGPNVPAALGEAPMRSAKSDGKTIYKKTLPRQFSSCAG